MNFTIKQLEVFAAVANSQSITIAAKQLHLTPPAIFKQIANLAANINIELFTTIGKRLILTPAGKQLFIDVEIYLTHSRELHSKIKQCRQLKVSNPVIRVSVNNSTQSVTFKLLNQFQKKQPLVNFELSVAPWGLQKKQLKKDIFDFYIMGDMPIDKKHYHTEDIGYFSFKLVASSQHPLANRKKITHTLLKSQRFITGNNPSPSQTFQNELLQKWQLEKPPLIVESYGSAREVVQAGIGIALLPPPVVSKEIQQGELVYLDFPFKSKRFPMQLVYRKKQVMSELFTEFKDYVIAHWNQDF